MNGFVDDELRALLEVQIGATAVSVTSGVVAWIDTAFNGGLVLPRNESERLELKECSSTPAILADGQQVELPMFTCYLDWLETSIARRLSPTKVRIPYSVRCRSTDAIYRPVTSA